MAVSFAAEEAAPAKPSVRGEVAKPIQAALELLKANQAGDALAKLKEAEAVAARTPFETYLIDRIKGQALALSGDGVAAAQSLEAAANSSAAPAADRLPLIAAATGQYYAAKEYAKAALSASRYEKDGGKDAGLHSLLVQSLFLSGDYAACAKLMAADIQAQEQAGQKPAEDQLKILAQCSLKQGDNAGYLATLKKLALAYPSKAYWPVLIQSLSHKSGMNTASDRLYLDYLRLQDAVGTLKQAGAYEAAAQIALQQGYPLEAKSFLDKGYAEKLLGQGADASRHRKLRDAVAKNVAEDNKLLGTDDARLASAKDGNPLFNAGFNYVIHGQADKGLSMMEAGLKKGGIRQLDDARLRLGYAYHLAGKPAQAITAFRAVPATNEGAAALAELWILYLSAAR
ncbi:hypothetical protein [Niveibacterium terrae]|uniref:hypothetical protein n=1 Tax=Niveibacterium terrae TaxID=3373598 RepID=UPI003A9348EC